MSFRPWDIVWKLKIDGIDGPGGAEMGSIAKQG